MTSQPDLKAGLLASSIHQFLRSRRSIRRFEDRPIDRSILERILETAMWSPSAHNRQPWRFVVLTDADDKRRLAESMADRLAADLRDDGVDEATIAADAGRSRRRIGEAPAVIAVCLTMEEMDRYPDARRQGFEHQMAVQGVAMAAETMLLAAHAEGLGACWLCAPLFCPDTVIQHLGLPADYEPQGLIVLGYPAEQRSRTRELLETRVIFR